MPLQRGVVVLSPPQLQPVARCSSGLGCSVPTRHPQGQRAAPPPRRGQPLRQDGPAEVRPVQRGRGLAAAAATLATFAQRRFGALARRARGGSAATLEAPPRVSPGLLQNVGAVLRFVVPALGSALLCPLLDTTDAIIVGRFGSVVDLAALSPAVAWSDMVWLLFTFLGATTVNMLAKARARKDFTAARTALSDICCLAVCLGVLVGGLVLANLNPVLEVLISPAALAAAGAPAGAYIATRAFFYPVMMLHLVLSAACFGGLQDTVTPLRASALGGFVNLAVDLVLIAGLGMGCMGAALGSVAGGTSALIILVRRLRRSRSFDDREPIYSREAKPLLASPLVWAQSLRRDRILPLLSFAAPFLAFQLMKVTLMLNETRMGSAFGPTSLAAHQIQYSLWRFLITLCDPIMQAAQALVPAHYSAGTLEGRVRARELGRAILLVSIVLGFLGSATGFLWSHTLPPLFTSNVAAAKEAASLALPSAISVLTLSVWHCNEGLMLATGRAKLLAILYTWNVVYFAAGSLYVLRNGLGLYHSWVVWASMHTIFSFMISVVLRLPGGLWFVSNKEKKQLEQESTF